ncbi:DUF485 domain-containing protein [Tsuneonella sp. HG094]|jgi:uncharacterized membrane protein (DUF485 family)
MSEAKTIAEVAQSQRLAQIAADPRYQALLARRSRFTWMLTVIMLAAYFGYILLIAFNKQLLSRPIGESTTTVGIPIGLGLILLGIFLTGVYVRRANSDFDPIVESIRQDLDK